MQSSETGKMVSDDQGQTPGYLYGVLAGKGQEEGCRGGKCFIS